MIEIHNIQLCKYRTPVEIFYKSFLYFLFIFPDEAWLRIRLRIKPQLLKITDPDSFNLYLIQKQKISYEVEVGYGSICGYRSLIQIRNYVNYGGSRCSRFKICGHFNSEIRAFSWCLISSRHFFRSRVVTNLIFFLLK